jgi:hypothetical protein
MADDWDKVRGETSRAFASGSVFTAPPEDLARYLQNICTGAIPNEGIRHAEIVRGITINNIQMSRVIRELEVTMQRLSAANDRTQTRITILTVVAVIVGVVQAVAAVLSILR